MRAALLVLVACLALAGTGRIGRGSPALVVAMLTGAAAVYSLGEVVRASASWELSFELADSTRSGEYQGLFSSGVTVGGVLAPVVFTWTLSTCGDLRWVVLGMLFLALGLSQPVLTSWASRHDTRHTPDTIEGALLDDPAH